MAKTSLQPRIVKPKLNTNIKKKKLLQSASKAGKSLKILVPKQTKEPKTDREPLKKVPPPLIAKDEEPRNYVKLFKFPFDKKQIFQGVIALFKVLKKVQTKQELFDEAQEIYLQVTCVKIPQTPTRLLRFNLKHGLLTDTGDICLIVADKGVKKDHDSTIEYYETILSKHGITNIKTILPFNQFKSEYGMQYELKRKLLGLYDHFLVDSKVGGKVTHLLGSIFYQHRKMPTTVKMDHPNLKQHFENATRTTIMKMHSKGDSYNLQVGHTEMTKRHIYENIMGVLEDFRLHFPGGLENVRGLGVKMARSITIPVYLTLKNKSAVPVPHWERPRPKNYKTAEGELSTELDTVVYVTPEGKVRVKRNKIKEQTDEVTKELENAEQYEDDIETDRSDVKKEEQEQNSDEDNDDLMKAEEEYLVNYEHEQEDDTKKNQKKKAKKEKKVKK
ncbi:hypothetical protein PPYR_12787 [Photinus pyralis]|uniref:Ribosomal protein L1 n=1 Tax=Photinus pyralis TaxID=7054 RepID=A0A1Y1N733_PHOPY|nr:ribosomal L1 domain-containing protein CG13096 [Photinus pyralis]KAB0793167.1 hypothetical protein PPYR_12787 [Photinus pyralis]